MKYDIKKCTVLAVTVVFVVCIIMYFTTKDKLSAKLSLKGDTANKSPVIPHKNKP